MIGQTNELLSASSDSFYSDLPSLIPEPSAHRQQNQCSNSLSLSSHSSEHDITDVTSINEQHPFHLESMKHVLLGLSTPTSRPSSPAYSHQQQFRDHYQQPCIHNHRTRVTSSAINRQKQQQRIERENLKILERLQQVRPTRSLKRDELLSNYDRHMGFNTYPTEPPFRPPNRPSSATNSLNNISIRSRPVSASNRSLSGRKPIWNDRWQQQE